MPAPPLDIRKRYHRKAIQVGYMMTVITALVCGFPDLVSVAPVFLVTVPSGTERRARWRRLSASPEEAMFAARLVRPASVGISFYCIEAAKSSALGIVEVGALPARGAADRGSRWTCRLDSSARHVVVMRGS